ncbi:MAG: argininosuccinate synthase [Methanoregulaceae archaeon]|jgi:hypothetical protein|nr:argininosuccinate synthase [Methanoregulaceae archaeon]
MAFVHTHPCEPVTTTYPVAFLCLLLVTGIFFLALPAAAATTTQLHIARYASDGTTLLNETTVDYQWMEAKLPVYGDGIIHYYHQGPVFIDDPDQGAEEILRWNSAEDVNVQEKDMGAVKGTSVRDLVDLVGGMEPGDTVTIRADDGFSKTFAYRNVYIPLGRQGPMVITWYREDEGYVPDYTTGMRLVFFSDTSTNPWGIHAFGNWDWHESADPEYYYYYMQGGERFPTTTGLSVQMVSSLDIREGAHITPPDATTPTPKIPLSILTIFFGIIGGVWIILSKGVPQ